MRAAVAMQVLDLHVIDAPPSVLSSEMAVGTGRIVSNPWSLGDWHTGAGRRRCAHVQSNKCTTTDDLFVINQLPCILCRTK